ncbi:MAG TPA: acetyl-CoA C-acyltransferase [Myxococcales bacterium]|nr:acetyl-CoA C-acyltransferase [Myxococcales bacterium]HAN32501.1 acetyl-CoA C-acyltransferase [Myxococcales bacterium]
MSSRTAVIVSAVRTPCGRGRKGSLAKVRPEDLAALAIRGAIERVDGLEAADVEDVIFGCAMPEGPQGMNIARIAALRAGLGINVPGVTVNRFCSSGLQTIAQAAERIMAGGADVLIAGGVESMSQVPMGGFKIAPHPQFISEWPEVYMPMGHTAEMVARKYSVSREDQDAFALESQKRAAAAMQADAFADEIVAVDTPLGCLEADELPRPKTTIEGLNKLRPVFQQRGGTVTAGNASPLTDGAAAVVVMSQTKAEQIGAEILGVYRGFVAVGVAPEIMGIGPVAAVPKLLEKTGVSLQEVDHIELNEAFAAQSLAVIRELKLDENKVNPLGGAIALGHPLGATGAKLTATALHQLKRSSGRYAIVTMCVGGGMGAAGLFERPA